MKTKTEPALTPEEWAEKEFWKGLDIDDPIVNLGPKGEVVLRDDDYYQGYTVRVIRRLDALAAFCLHGQPFGFTWEDVDRLRLMGNPAFWDLADRIEALLQPRDG